MTSVKLVSEGEGLDLDYSLIITYLPHPEKHLYEVGGRVDLGINVGPRWIWSGEKVDLNLVESLDDLSGSLGRQVIDLIYESNEQN